MGTLYRRKVKYCTTCRQRLARTSDWRACADAKHVVVVRERPIWWIRYQVGGRSQCVSSESTKKADAKRLLHAREAVVADSVPTMVSVGPVTYEEAAEDLLNEYRMNGRRSLHTATLRLRNYLAPHFGQRHLGSITTTDVRTFVAQRLSTGAANGSVNRNVTLLKRMFTLAMQAGKLTTRPYIPLLKENNVRKGFFEPEQFRSVKQHLPAHLQPIVEFAFVTGWRTPSEILPLEWRHVDMQAGEVRLDAGTTKNGEGRVFPFTRELRRVLEQQHAVAETLKREQGLIARFVFCYTFGRKAGKCITSSGFHKA
jgi:integrase